MNVKLEVVDPVPVLQKGDTLYQYNRRHIQKFTVTRVTPTQAILVIDGLTYERKCKREGHKQNTGDIIAHLYPGIGEGYNNYRAPDAEITALYETQELTAAARSATDQLQMLFIAGSVPVYAKLKAAFDSATAAVNDLLANTQPFDFEIDTKQ